MYIYSKMRNFKVILLFISFIVVYANPNVRNGNDSIQKDGDGSNFDSSTNTNGNYSIYPDDYNTDIEAKGYY